jgi:hypothetical protein
MVDKVKGKTEEGAPKTRRFALRKDNGEEYRQAALKAANKSAGTSDKPVILKLREHGTKKLHVFKGWKAVVDAPKNRPAWLPEKINRAFVEKVKIEQIEK